jgi:hypothetical protein
MLTRSTAVLLGVAQKHRACCCKLPTQSVMTYQRRVLSTARCGTCALMPASGSPDIQVGALAGGHQVGGALRIDIRHRHGGGGARVQPAGQRELPRSGKRGHKRPESTTCLHCGCPKSCLHAC